MTALERIKKIKADMANDPHLQRNKKSSSNFRLHVRHYYSQMMRALSDDGYIREGEWGI